MDTRLNAKSVAARDTIAGERYSLRRLVSLNTARMINRFKSVPAKLSNPAARPAIIDSAVECTKLVSFETFVKRGNLESTVIQHMSL